jgi:hypothetical protein
MPIERLAVILAKGSGLSVWFDKWVLVPGRAWQ